jgi:hypothetical protein
MGPPHQSPLYVSRDVGNGTQVRLRFPMPAALLLKYSTGYPEPRCIHLACRIGIDLEEGCNGAISPNICSLTMYTYMDQQKTVRSLTRGCPGGSSSQ